MNTRSGFSATSADPAGFASNQAMPKKPTPIAPARHRIIHDMAMRRAGLMVRTESAAMKRARIWGWPM